MFWLTTSPCSYAEHPDVVTEIIRMFWMWEIWLQRRWNLSDWLL